MPYIVADPCVKCKFTDCVLVCPVDCFYEGKNFLTIHPDECIDCGACEPECPATAIFEETELPDKWEVYTEINAVYSGAKKLKDAKVGDWPQHLIDGFTEAWPQNDSAQRDALPGADDLKDVDGKINDLDPAPYEG